MNGWYVEHWLPELGVLPNSDVKIWQPPAWKLTPVQVGDPEQSVSHSARLATVMASGCKVESSAWHLRS